MKFAPSLYQASFLTSPFSEAQTTSVNLLLLIQEKALILQTTSCYSWNYDNSVLATNQWTFKMQSKQQNSLLNLDKPTLEWARLLS